MFQWKRGEGGPQIGSSGTSDLQLRQELLPDGVRHHCEPAGEERSLLLIEAGGPAVRNRLGQADPRFRLESQHSVLQYRRLAVVTGGSGGLDLRLQLRELRGEVPADPKPRAVAGRCRGGGGGGGGGGRWMRTSADC